MRPRAVSIVACLVLAGCGGDGTGSPLTPGAVQRRDPNATDAAFVRAMVPHQRAGVAAADIASRRAKRSELRAIGAEIEKAQSPTIAQLQALTPDDPPPRGRAAGSPPAIDPSRLRDPVSFDHEFLTMMIRHHEQSIALAEEEQDRGGDDRIKRIAAQIFESQKRELEELRRRLRTWYGVDGSQGPGGTPPPSGGSPDT